jgi:hypothetical protein
LRRALPTLVLSCALPAVAAAFPAAAPDAELSVEIEKLGPALSPLEIPSPTGGGGEVVPILDSIINIGSKVWTIIDKNRPVVDVKTQYATALPEGVRGWGAMAGWRPPQGTIYALRAKNAYGTTVINVRYQVLRTYGGSYKGTGKYLTAVTVEPLLVEVAWGYKFTLEAAVPETSVVNVGTSEEPVAAMMPQLSWRISTAVKDSQGKAVYYVQGDGVFRELGAPFKDSALDAARGRVAKASEEALQSGL